MAGEEVVGCRGRRRASCGSGSGATSARIRAPAAERVVLALHEEARLRARPRGSDVSVTIDSGKPRAKSARTRASPHPTRSAIDGAEGEAAERRGAGRESAAPARRGRRARRPARRARRRGVPSLRPTPRKLKRRTAAPCACRALAARKTHLEVHDPAVQRMRVADDGGRRAAGRRGASGSLRGGPPGPAMSKVSFWRHRAKDSDVNAARRAASEAGRAARDRLRPAAAARCGGGARAGRRAAAACPRWPSSRRGARRASAPCRPSPAAARSRPPCGRGATASSSRQASRPPRPSC